MTVIPAMSVLENVWALLQTLSQVVKIYALCTKGNLLYIQICICFVRL